MHIKCHSCILWNEPFCRTEQIFFAQSKFRMYKNYIWYAQAGKSYLVSESAFLVKSCVSNCMGPAFAISCRSTIQTKCILSTVYFIYVTHSIEQRSEFVRPSSTEIWRLYYYTKKPKIYPNLSCISFILYPCFVTVSRAKIWIWG